jgi:DNA-binding PadR family transcriptional regulator
MRAKKYSLTPQGREIVEKDINDFVEALEKISAFVER